jgi:hypothetical protein
VCLRFPTLDGSAVRADFSPKPNRWRNLAPSGQAFLAAGLTGAANPHGALYPAQGTIRNVIMEDSRIARQEKVT